MYVYSWFPGSTAPLAATPTMSPTTPMGQRNGDGAGGIEKECGDKNAGPQNGGMRNWGGWVGWWSKELGS